MIIQTFIGEPIKTNSYLLVDETSLEAAVVDAPVGTVNWLKSMPAGSFKLKYHLITHAHWDHVLESALIGKIFGVPLAIHKADAQWLEIPQARLWPMIPQYSTTSAGIKLQDQDTMLLGATKLQVIHTPGHTPGGACFYCAADNVLFSGDTLFAGTYGRTDFPGGDDAIMRKSIIGLSKLPEETKVFPGHSKHTTIGKEIEWMATASPAW